MNKEYKEIVSQIKNLPWNTYDPKEIIILSWISAIEFAKSLHCALGVYPGNVKLKEMARGELNTDNLSYDNYSHKGDHWQFLDHFCFTWCKSEIYTQLQWRHKVARACSKYDEVLKSMSNTERAMTVFSREYELPNIFKEILKAHDWDSLKLGYYKYYLERHIELDNEEGGHANLVADFETNDEVLLRFYKARLELYQSLQ